MVKLFTCWFITDPHTNVYAPSFNLLGLLWFYNKWINCEQKIITTNRVGISSIHFYLGTCKYINQRNASK